MKEYNEGHQIEALDRIDGVIEIINNRIKYHPAINKACLRLNIDSVIRELSRCYQKVGELEDKE